jgi:hypothetical protein
MGISGKDQAHEATTIDANAGTLMSRQERIRGMVFLHRVAGTRKPTLMSQDSDGTWYAAMCIARRFRNIPGVESCMAFCGLSSDVASIAQDAQRAYIY